MHTNSKILKHSGNAFIEAYLLYKLGKYKEALSIVSKFDGIWRLLLTCRLAIPFTQVPVPGEDGTVQKGVAGDYGHEGAALEGNRLDRIRRRTQNKLYCANVLLSFDQKRVPKARTAGGTERKKGS